MAKAKAEVKKAEETLWIITVRPLKKFQRRYVSMFYLCRGATKRAALETFTKAYGDFADRTMYKVPRAEVACEKYLYLL